MLNIQLKKHIDKSHNKVNNSKESEIERISEELKALRKCTEESLTEIGNIFEACFNNYNKENDTNYKNVGAFLKKLYKKFDFVETSIDILKVSKEIDSLKKSTKRKAIKKKPEQHLLQFRWHPLILLTIFVSLL